MYIIVKSIYWFVREIWFFWNCMWSIDGGRRLFEEFERERVERRVNFCNWIVGIVRWDVICKVFVGKGIVLCKVMLCYVWRVDWKWKIYFCVKRKEFLSRRLDNLVRGNCFEWGDFRCRKLGYCMNGNVLWLLGCC